MKLRLTLEYDGTGFRGWARQPGLRTIEGTVQGAFDGVFPRWADLVVGGRTDTGVHARGQVCSVEVEGGPPSDRVAEALNTALPDDVAVLSAAVVPSDFHARFSARSRSYRYVVLNRRERSALEARRALWLPQPLDAGLLDAAAALVVGEHDFRAFTPTETQHHLFVREVFAARWERVGDHLHFTVTADSFLRHMVRTLVGTMLEHGGEGLVDLLAGRPRAEAGMTAAPWGLYLEHVEY
ncbi:MAG: tRNA pseudouridine(38-40) synthase TruA [Gaiellaceae bacterium]